MRDIILLAIAAALEIAFTGLGIATHHYGALPYTGTISIVLVLILVVHLMRRHHQRKSEEQEKKLNAFFERSSDES